jgi:folate-binding protein YgfZ
MGTSSAGVAHEAIGGRPMELDGRPVVADYGDPEAEHRRVREAGGFIDRSYRGKLRVTGPDRADLLQSMTTNDVVKQAEDTVIPDAICTGHGKVQSVLACLKRADDFLLDMDPAVTAFTRDFLIKYTIVRDAETRDESDAIGHVGLYGPEAPAVLAEALGVDAKDLPAAPGAAGAPVREGPLVIATDALGVPGFELWVAREHLGHLWDALTRAGTPRGVGPFGFTALEALRIEMGVPRFGVEVDDDVILLEAGLDAAANFEKGCYIGQETLSRIVFRGHVNRRLRGLVVEGAPPEPGTAVTDGDQAVGEVRSAAFSPTLGGTVALAYLKRSHWEAGTAVQVGPDAARVADLPLIPVPG